jgi:DNA (cytosine-5)-methyltransferase 1
MRVHPMVQTGGLAAVDLFAGWGGFTEAAATEGVRVAWAANHWPLAVEAHRRNHPDTLHECQDLRQADWTKLPPFELLLASPACQGHSTASQPKRRVFHDALRATAWAVVDCADVTEPENLIVENVPAFRRWRLYPQWRSSLEALGYHLTELEVLASEHGVPQRRERLFIVGTRRHRRPVVLERDRVEPAFGPCIQWDEGAWRPIAKCAGEQARERILAARARHGERVLVQHVTGHPGVPLHEPIRTITTKDQWVVVRGDDYRPLTKREYARGMGFRDGYSWPEHVSRADTIKGLGNAVCPPAAARVIRATLAA